MPTILIVDDHEPSRLALKRLVSDLGIAVVAESVSRAVAILSTIQVDACLVDYDLNSPREDGGRLLAWIRANRPALAARTVLLSAFGSASIVHDHTIDRAVGPTRIREYLQAVLDSGRSMA